MSRIAIHQSLSALVRLGGEHEPRRVAVEAVNDAQTVVLALHVAEVGGAAMEDQRVDERAVAMVDGRMAHQSRLLGEDDQILVLVADVEVDRLPCHARGSVVGHLVNDRVPRMDDVLLAGRRAVDEHEPLLGGTSRRRAARVATVLGQDRIEAQPVIGSARHMAQGAAHRASPSSDAPSSPRQKKMTATKIRTTPHVTPISAMLNTGKSMKDSSMKSTT